MTAKPELLIIGAGGFGRETASMVADLDTFTLLGFLDDDETILGTDVGGIPIVGPIESARQSEAALVVTTGRPSNFGSRRRIVEKLALSPERYVTLMHPSAVIGGGCTVGVGTVMHAGCVLTTDVSIGEHVAVMPNTVLTHDDRVDDYVTFGAGVLVAGDVNIGRGAYVGSGVRIREGVTIGQDTLIGMGSVVLNDVPPDSVWAGVPASRLTTRS